MTLNTSYSLRILSLLIFITLLQFSFCSSYNCQHDKLDHSIEIAHEHVSKHIGRRLQDSDYSNIQIYADFSLLQTDMDETLRDYVQNDLIASAILYYQQTLKVIPRGKNLTTTKQTICGIPTPSIFQNGGVAADIGFIIDAGTDDSEYIAYARACVLSGSNNRPLFGNVHLNLKYLKMGTAMDLQQNLIVALHEMAHVFGISSGLFQYYYNPETGSTRTGHIKQKTVNNVSTVVVDIEPLTSKLKAFYGCSLIDGVLMENQGGAESTNSHLERRIFFHEIMTASEIEGARLSDFMLAFLEGTGWYKGNYNMTEPLYWGKEKGCDFYYGSCMKTSNSHPPTPNFEEFCSNITATGCSADRRYAAICGGPSQAKQNLTIPSFNYWGDGTVVADIFADNCPYFETNSDIDCENPLFQGSAFLKTEVYGQGSKCFTGSLGSASTTKRTYCLKASCEQQKDSSFVMKINLGSTVATCKDSGPLFVDGYDGELDCPDPNEYCSTFGSSFCGRGCMGRGQCVNNTCQCNIGWGGNDCSTRVYVDKCERCSGNVLETACYGDGCSEVPVAPTPSIDNSDDNTQNTVTVESVNNAKNAKSLEVIEAMLVFGLIALIAF